MKTGNTAYKSAVGLALATPFLLVWMIGAVGVLGREGDRADLMYIAVFAVGIIGAIVSRFQPRGMARALFATALAQAWVLRRVVSRIGLVVSECCAGANSRKRRAEGSTHAPAIESETADIGRFLGTEIETQGFVASRARLYLRVNERSNRWHNKRTHRTKGGSV